MKETKELTDEMIEDAMKCIEYESCHKCEMQMHQINDCISALATALQAERAKPKVWDGAPDGYDVAYVTFIKSDQLYEYGTRQKYTRELPKSRIYLIAEKASSRYRETLEGLEDCIKAAILEYAEAGGEK